MSLRQINLLAFLIVFNTIMSVNQWSALPIGNTFVVWTVNACILLFLLKEMWHQKSEIFRIRYIICTLFLSWAYIGTIRGIDVAENYWEYKQLVEGTFCLSLPLLIYSFADENVCLKVLRKWNQWMLPLFFLFFIWVIKPGTYHFLIWPVFLYGIFAKNLPKPWLIGIFLVFLAMLEFGITDRAQMIKVLATSGLAFLFMFRGYFSRKLLRFVHWGFYVGGITLLVLGVTGEYNVFEKLENEKGKMTTISTDKEGNRVIEDAAADTRTFIYQEVISSAINHDYIWTGRTPARGNDSFFFGKEIAEDLGTNKYERHSNEVCHPNVFTWLGLIGMLLYSFIYLQASWLAIYRSNSHALKVLGCFIAFHWAMGWIEDQNRFNISNIFLWMCIAMCLSERFRMMDDDDFYYWFYCIFHNEEYIPLDAIEEEKLYIEANEQE